MQEDDASFDLSEHDDHFNLRNCPYCGKEIDLDSADEDDGNPICPHCDKVIRDERF